MKEGAGGVKPRTGLEIGVNGVRGRASLLMASHRSGKQKGPNLSVRNAKDVEEK
jgi:hypothetical protein